MRFQCSLQPPRSWCVIRVVDACCDARNADARSLALQLFYWNLVRFTALAAFHDADDAEVAATYDAPVGDIAAAKVEAKQTAVAA